MKAKLMELLMLCHVFSLKEPVFFEFFCTEFFAVATDTYPRTGRASVTI